MCEVLLCGKPAKSKGLCESHYGQKRYSEKREELKAKSRERYEENREELNEYSKAQHKKDAPRRNTLNRDYRYRTFYNITVEEYERIREYMRAHPKHQHLLNGANATMREAVEHRHKDGLIRGVMATMLNRAYGVIENLYGDRTPEVLEALAEFHRRPPAEQALGEKVYGLIGRAKAKKVMKYGPTGSAVPQVRGMFEKAHRGE